MFHKEEIHKFVLPETAIIIIIIIMLKMYYLSFFPEGWGDSVLLIFVLWL